MHPEIIQYDNTYKLIEFGKGSEKLSLDFRYVFSGMLKLGETIRLGDTDCDLKDMPGPYICCAYDRSAAKKEMTGAGLSCGKDYLFAEDLFYLLDDLKGSKIAYATCSKKISDRLKAVSFGYAAKHGKILPEDPYAEILSGGHRRSSRSPLIQRLYHAIYLIPGLIEAIPQLFASGKEYEGYDLICFVDAANAIGYKKDHPDAGDRVITTEMLKARTMASLYMRAVYFDKDQYTCECDMPFKTLWIGKGGTARLCDCPDYLDVSCGNIGVLSASDVWDSPMACIIRLSVINNTYTFCSKNLCGKFAGGCRSAEVLKRTDITAADHPLTINIANDQVCNLHCPSCRKKVYAVNDECTQREADACMDELINSGWLDKADKLLVGGGGEAFLSANYKRVLYDGSIRRNSITIMTNGTLFTGDEWKRLEGKYEHISFMVSVDAATKQTYEKVRCGGAYDRLMKNMDFLSKLRSEGKVESVKVIMIVQEANYREIPEFIRWAKDKGFDGVNLSRIRNWGTYDDIYFYEHVSMFDGEGRMKPELAAVLEDHECGDPIVNMNWKA